MSKLKKGLKKHKKKAGDDVMISNKDGKMDFADEKSKKAAEDLCVSVRYYRPLVRRVSQHNHLKRDLDLKAR
jgi:hypothetical protein